MGLTSSVGGASESAFGEDVRSLAMELRSLAMKTMKPVHEDSRAPPRNALLTRCVGAEAPKHAFGKDVWSLAMELRSLAMKTMTPRHEDSRQLMENSEAPWSALGEDVQSLAMEVRQLCSELASEVPLDCLDEAQWDSDSDSDDEEQGLGKDVRSLAMELRSLAMKTMKPRREDSRKLPANALLASCVGAEAPWSALGEHVRSLAMEVRQLCSELASEVAMDVDSDDEEQGVLLKDTHSDAESTQAHDSENESSSNVSELHGDEFESI